MNQPNSPIRAIVFDCFGVLYEDAYRQLIERHVAEASGRQYYYDLARGNDQGYVADEDLYSELSALSGEDPKLIMRRLRNVNLINQSVVDIIKELRPKYKIGMLSNAERALLDRFLANENLASHFDTILASSETPYIKPQREIFEELAGRLQLDFSQIIFIDDSATNVAAAASYGMQAIHYQDPLGLRTALAEYIN